MWFYSWTIYLIALRPSSQIFWFYSNIHVSLDTVRDGPIYGCVSCHRLLYNNAVVEIRNIEDFKDKLDELEDGLVTDA